VPRWNLVDWIVVAVPVATSNFLWMFTAFLGVARAWSYTTPMRDILEIAAALFLVVQCGVFIILAMAGRNVRPDHRGWADRLARSLAAVGSLGRTQPVDDAAKSSSRHRRSREEAANASRPGASSLSPATEPSAEAPRPTLRLVGERTAARGRRSAR